MERARQMLNGTGIRVWQVKEGERAEGVILRTWTNKTVVEFFTIQVSVTGGCPDLDVLTVHILVETVGDSGSGRLVVTLTRTH
jgi:hypothetical protein